MSGRWRVCALNTAGGPAVWEVVAPTGVPVGSFHTWARAIESLPRLIADHDAVEKEAAAAIAEMWPRPVEPIRRKIVPATGQGVIRAIPRVYKGVQFRSTLEADWAYNLDLLNIAWEHEPEGLDVGGVWYRPDFYLPDTRDYLEVKGHHDQGVEKAYALADALDAQESRAAREHLEAGDSDYWVEPQLVIIGRPAVMGMLTWQLLTTAGQGGLNRCPACKRHYWYDPDQGWDCRNTGCFGVAGSVRRQHVGPCADVFPKWHPLPARLRE